jgi:hypothetical protein
MKSLFIPGADGHHSSCSKFLCQEQQLTGLLKVKRLALESSATGSGVVSPGLRESAGRVIHIKGIS